MKLQAIYDDGRLELPQDIRFAHKRFQIQLDVPDEEIVSLPNGVKSSSAGGSVKGGVGDSISKILGVYRLANSKVKISGKECKDIWHKNLEDKYIEKD